jgi:hypothetical protein
MASNVQRARRYAFWRGLAIALVAFTGWIAAYGLADRISNGVPL